MDVFGTVDACGQVTLPEEIRDKLGIKPGNRVTFRVSGSRQVELAFWPHLTLQELIERYPITEPIDWERFEEEWQEEAVKDVVGS